MPNLVFSTDTNILAYLAGVTRDALDDAKIERVRGLMGQLCVEVSLVAPTQTLGELFVVLRRGSASAEESRSILLEFAQAFGTFASETRTPWLPLIWSLVTNCNSEMP